MPYILEQKPRATIIPKANVSLKHNNYVIDAFVTGWTEPTHTLKSHVAQEPLENGALVSDHVVALPVELEMKGMVSDVRDGGDAPGRAWEKVRYLHLAKIIMDISTEWSYYKDMVIKSAETTQEGRGMEFTIHFQQILRVGIGIHDIVNEEIKREDETTVKVPFDVAGSTTVHRDPQTGDLVSSGNPISKEDLESIWNL